VCTERGQRNPLLQVTPQPATSRAFLIGHELRAALRSLWRSPGYALPALLTLTLGIGVSTAVFSVYSAIELRPLPFARESELVQVGLAGGTGWTEGTLDYTLSPQFAEEFRALGSVFESLAVRRGGVARLTRTAGVSGVTGTRELALQRTSLDFFDALGASAEFGRLYSARGPTPDGMDGLVLRQSFWLETFAGEPVVGQTVLVDDAPKTVLGILPDDQAIPSSASAWIPEPTPAVNSRFWLIFNQAIARLRPGVSLAVARQHLQAHSEAHAVQDSSGATITGTLTPLRDTLVGSQRSAVSLLLRAVLLFLLLGCANVAALLAARVSRRRKEDAVRSALGASRTSLARQALLEGVLLVALAGGLGFVLLQLSLRFIATEYSAILANIPLRADWRVLAAFTALLTVSLLLSSLAPMLHSRKVQPMAALRGQGGSSEDRPARRVRQLLVAVQIAATVALLLNAGLLVRSLRALLAVETGIDVNGVVVANVMAATAPRAEGDAGHRAQRAEAKATTQRILARLTELPGAASACAAGDLPFDASDITEMFEINDPTAAAAQAAHPHWVSPGCFATFGTRLLAGRDFAIEENQEVAIVNRAFARLLLGTEDVLGRQVRFGKPPDLQGQQPYPWMTIVGVSENALETNLGEPPPPTIYLPLSSRPLIFWNSAGFRIAIALKARDAIEPYFKALPEAVAEVTHDSAVFDLERLSTRIEHTLRTRRILERLFTGFGLAALVLGAIGLFGVTAYSVAMRVPELAIRRALGAPRVSIFVSIVRETGSVVLGGLLLGLGLSYAARPLLQGFLFGVTPSDTLTHAVVCLSIPLVAFLAALHPARTAASISPLRALSEH
jgi:putative ABC transport system permease protein